MPTEQLAFLHNRRGGFKGRITAVQNEINTNPDSITLARAQSMLESIKSAYEKFDSVQAEVELQDPNELEATYRAEVDTLFDNVRYRLVDIIEEKKKTNEITRHRPKLPDLTVPKFTGNIVDWLAFKNVFKEIVDKASIDNVSKYQYLETSLVGGSAYHLIKSVSGSDYVTAWSRLETEYNHMGVIREKHIKDLYDVECCNGSSSSLQRFIDTVESNLNALRSLEVNVESWDLLLIHHLSTKLDQKTRKEFESIKKPDSNVTFTEFTSFIKKQIRVIQAMEVVTFSPIVTSTPMSVKPKSQEKDNKTNRKPGKAFSATTTLCILCNESHSLCHCQSFLNMDIKKRKEFVLEKKCCFNCLKQSHWSNSCPSTGRCKHCNRSHHTLLHVNTVPVSQTEQSRKEGAPNMVATIKSHRVILATAAIVLENPITGKSVVCRAFLDGGATNHFITERICQMLSLDKMEAFTEIVGINGTTTVNKYSTIALLKSRNDEMSEEIELLVSRKIVEQLPIEPIHVQGLGSLHNLADPNFNTPGRIDVLLGASIFYKIINGTKKEISPGLYLLPSQFGDLLVGQQEKGKTAHAFCSIQDLKEKIQRFWCLEGSLFTNGCSTEEKLTEKHYAATTKRMPDGKYSVALPFNTNVKRLGSSREKTKQYFLRQESNLERNPEKYDHYRDFIQEMIDMDHLEEDKNTGNIDNFITHHIISRPSSTTTKHRVVFNASMKTESGISLNDCLMTGPTIQQPIFVHLLHWREHQVAFVGDIAKMYRQIWHHDEDRNYLKIWWRPSKKEELKAYRIKCVTYGTGSAPFAAVRTLKQLAEDEMSNFPAASQLLTNNFYVDDFSGSFRTEEEAIDNKNNLTALLKSGGFPLRKFSSNSSKVVENPSDDEIRTLGVIWNVKSDNIIMSIGNIYFHANVTKSSVLSEIAQLFDPLGLCSPVVLKAKLIMQKTWLEGIKEWDTELPDSLKDEWNEFRNQLKEMSPVEVPRNLISTHDMHLQIHGFCDASEKGYGACIYIRTETHCRLVCSKTRVVSINKKQTIPRLELQSALLLSRLMKVTTDAMSSNFRIFLWSDSQITIFRIKSAPNRYCQFVGTRLSEIQELTLPDNWFYVPSKLNPADICSRGLMPNELSSSEMWFHGPSFLTNPQETWPSQERFNIDESQLEYAPQVNATAVVTEEHQIIERFSNFSKLLRVTSYIIRFMLNVKKSRKYRIDSSQAITTHESQEALSRLIRLSQHKTFKEDIKLLQQRKQIDKSSRLWKLNPFIDPEGILRVGGRLNNAKLKFDNQHQIILSPEMHLSQLILEHLHRINIHCGPQSLLNTSRQRYWIIKGRNLCRKIVHKCVTCVKNKPILINQIMGQLPASRLEPTRPFQIVGVDYCGYFNIKPNFRSKVITKAYICLITCFVTRATHLEVVYDLTTEAFLAALRRFVSRRGIPSDIHSDNATNFVGASRQLTELRQLLLSQQHKDEVQQFCTEYNINWHFIPPRSPHFGALWESSIKQAKYHLKRSINDMKFTVEQLTTIVCQIEACLNSRPITQVSDDPEDFKALTPGHFLIGQELNALPEPIVLDLNINRLDVWQRMQHVVQEFWYKWKRDYINSLQTINKWNVLQPNLQIGTLVLISEDNLPPNQWLMGRIIQLHPGNDNLVRVATIKTTKGIIRRSIHKLAPLLKD